MSIFPMIDPGQAGTGQDQTLPLCRETAWDFARDVPRFKNGQPETVAGKEAVRVWIWRALHTPRFRYEIYSAHYGCELEALMGQACGDAVKTAEAPRYLRECLLVNPYITEVRDISAVFESARLTVTGTAVTIYGEVDIYAII